MGMTMIGRRPCRLRAVHSSSRGMASVLAMLFLVLFATLAVGFVAESTTTVQISRNERSLQQAQAACESGMQFIRYQLDQLNVPSGDTGAALLNDVAAGLGQALNGAASMNGHAVAVTNGTLYLPSSSDYIVVDSNTGLKFQAAITASGEFLSVKCTGYGPVSGIGKALQIQFDRASRAGTIFNYGVAARGPVQLSGNATIQGATDPTKGSVLSTTAGTPALSMSGSASISGDFSYTNSAAVNSYGGTIAGLSSSSPNFSQHIHSGIAAPQFPSIDTSVYAQYATNTWTSATGKTVVNCVVPANANPNFSGGTTIQGVLYIKTPNQVSFSGNTTIQGCIVVENNPQGTSNSLSFSGNVTALTIDTLPANSTFPAGERALTGAFILAPTFAVTFSGNFGTIGGSMIADSFSFSGNASGTVDGSVIALKDVPLVMSGNGTITVQSGGTSAYPTGVNFGYNYVPLPGTYIEVLP